MTIALASDHGGFALKEAIKAYLAESGREYKDYGAFDDSGVDYPLIIESACDDILNKKVSLGIFVCGTGIGISMAANKHGGIRAACVSETFSARLSREHNDANVLCLGGRVLAPEYAFGIVDVFLKTPFSNEERHRRRLNEMSDLETRL